MYCAGQRLVVEQCRLGDLDLQPVRRQAGGLQRRLDLVDDLAVAEILGGEIDRDADFLGPADAFGAGGLSTKVLISETIPISSASGMNTAGEIGPRSRCSQRHSASQLAMRIVSMATIGW